MILRIVLFYLLTFIFIFLMGGIQQVLGLTLDLTTLPEWGSGLAGFMMLLIFRNDRLSLHFNLKGIPLSKFVRRCYCL